MLSFENLNRISVVLFLVGRYPFVFHSNFATILTNYQIISYTISFQLISSSLLAYQMYNSLRDVLVSEEYTESRVQKLSLTINVIFMFAIYCLTNILGFYKIESHALGLQKLCANKIPLKVQHKWFLNFCKFLICYVVQFVGLVITIFFLFRPSNLASALLRLYFFLIQTFLYVIVAYARSIIGLMIFEVHRLNVELVTVLSNRHIYQCQLIEIFDNFDRIEQSKECVSRSVGAQLFVIFIYMFQKMTVLIFAVTLAIMNGSAIFIWHILCIHILPDFIILILLVEKCNQLGIEV